MFYFYVCVFFFCCLEEKKENFVETTTAGRSWKTRLKLLLCCVWNFALVFAAGAGVVVWPMFPDKKIGGKLSADERFPQALELHECRAL